ncbi:magnesium transporter [Teredinibacter franksiae]|uniref:magnesium transporter n=1 Tax=Teredinibacter franksiae TaxID=2761453 RepID=UPI001623601F|nr:magnesium transporter [Teredinibacter franksiae]
MPQAAEQADYQPHAHLSKMQAMLDSGTFRQVRQMLNGLRPVEIAHLIESSPPPSRTLLWDLVDKEVSGEVLEELGDDVKILFLEGMGTEELVEITEGLETDDAVDILQQLPEQVIQEVLEAMSDQDRARVEEVIAYDEETAGGLTNTDTITVRPRFTLDVVLRYLRRHPELPPSTDSLIVVNRKDDYLGVLPLSKLLTTDPSVTVREVMVTDTNAIPASMADKDVAKLFEQHDWVSAPVVNDQGKLLGRITIDDVVDVIREEADHSLMSMAGLDEDEDTFSTARRSIPRRATWLGINLLTAILASSVISLFDATIEKLVALAILMPIVASMGGVAGSQTLTVVIRGMALGHIGSSNLGWLLSREVRVGLFNGLLWAIVMAGIAAWWFNDVNIAMILGAAMVINLLTAAVAGALLPVALKSMKIDPALAGGVTLTTITDVVGFFSFLGLAAFFYG